MTNPTLQAELEQVIQDIIALGTDHSNDLPAPQNESDALQAILATVSKHLPEKVKDRTGETPEGRTYHTKNGSWVTSEDYGRNTVITEMEKTLGGSV